MEITTERAEQVARRALGRSPDLFDEAMKDGGRWPLRVWPKHKEMMDGVQCWVLEALEMKAWDTLQEWIVEAKASAAEEGGEA